MCYYEELVLHVCISLALRGPSKDQNLGRSDTMPTMRSRRELEFQKRSQEGFSWPAEEGHSMQARHYGRKRKKPSC